MQAFDSRNWRLSKSILDQGSRIVLLGPNAVLSGEKNEPTGQSGASVLAALGKNCTALPLFQRCLLKSLVSILAISGQSIPQSQLETKQWHRLLRNEASWPLTPSDMERQPRTHMTGEQPRILPDSSSIIWNVICV